MTVQAERGATIQNVVQVVGNPPPVRSIFQAPPLPSTFVDRFEVSDPIKNNLITDRKTASGVLVVSAIHGLGGIGKSTLATAIARDPQVRERFHDGVLWSTLGQQPVLLSLLSGWIQALGDYFYQAYAVEAARTHLNNLLQDKAVLLVVDDVWNPSDALTFLVGGPQCRVLITTREATIASITHADLFNLDVMTSEQALALMQGRLGKLTCDERAHALALAEAVGYLPLALELAAAQVAGGVPWVELRQDIEAEIARLERLDLPGAREETNEAARKRLSLLASFYLSLRRLSEEQRSAFAWLGVLPEDVTLTPAMAAILWDSSDQQEARDTLRQLRDKALLLPNLSLPDGTITCRLHDLLHDISRKLLLDSPSPQQADGVPGLGFCMREAHAALLNRYWARTQNNQWSTLPDDGYLHMQLTWHMEKAGWVEELHALLREETPAGKNAWYEVRESLGQTAGFLDNVKRAWMLSEVNDERPIKREFETKGVLEMRYALITASLNSLAKNILPELLSALVKKRIWTTAQGLTLARQVPDHKQRLEALASLVPCLEGQFREDVLGEALEEGQLISDDLQAEVLTKLAPKLVAEKCPAEALEVALAINDSGDREAALEALTYTFRKYGLIKEAWVATQAIVYADTKGEILEWLLPELIRSGYLTEAYEAALQWNNEELQAWDWDPVMPQTLTEIALKLVESGQLDQALEIINELDAQEYEESLLTVISIKLARNGYYEAALEFAMETDDEDDRNAMLLGIAPHIPRELMPVPLKSMLGIEVASEPVDREQASESSLSDEELKKALDLVSNSESSRGPAALVELAIHAPQSLREQALEEALEEVNGMEDGMALYETLTTLIPHLPDHLLSKALQYTCTHSDQMRCEALIRMANYFPRALMEKLVTVAGAIKQPDTRAQAFLRLLPLLPEALKEKVKKATLAAIEKIEEDARQAETMKLLLPHLSESELKNILSSIGIIYRSRLVVEALIQRALHPPKTLQHEIYKNIQKIRGFAEYVEALAISAPILPESLRDKALREQLDRALAIETDESRREVLAVLAPQLTEPLLRRALEAVRTIGDKEQQDLELAWLTPHDTKRSLRSILKAVRNDEDEPQSFTPMRLTTIFLKSGYPEKALEIILLIKDEQERFLALLLCVLHLPVPMRRRALRLLRAYVDPTEEIEELPGYMPFMPNPSFREALEIVLAIENGWLRDEALFKMALELVELGYAETALGIALTIGDVEKRDQTLKTLSIKLAGLDCPRLALDAVRDIDDAGNRIATLEILAPHLRKTIFIKALDDVRQIHGERNRAMGLAAIAPCLPESLIPEALEIARSMRWVVARAEALAGLIPFVTGLLKTEVSQEFNEATQAIAHEEQRQELLARLALIKSRASRLKRDVRSQGLAHARQREVSKSTQRVILIDSMEKIPAMENREERIETLGAIALNLIKNGDPSKALEVAWSTEDVKERTLVSDKIAPYLSKFPFETIYFTWHERLRTLANKTRRDLLKEMYTLITPFIHSNSANIRAEIASALRDVGRWWP